MTIDVMGLRTRVLVAGESDGGDPVVMIHGVGGWAENWRDVMEPIAASGRRAYAVDLPGFGESERPKRVRYFDPEDAFYPRFMVAALDALGLRTAHVVGNSMGGAVAYMLAVSAPERTRSLVLAAAGGLGTDIALFLRVATLPGTIALAKVLGRPAHGRDVLRSCFYDPSRISEELFSESERYGFASYPEFVRALRSGVTLRGVRPELRRAWIGRAQAYRGPVLVVWGREDPVLPLHHVDDLRDIFPEARLHVIERCGHMPMAERPEEFLGAVLPFIERAERAVAA
ncbi:MAG TPA: alpha/beta fold hydrolase [Candidatus Limnocylindria bacterium]